MVTIPSDKGPAAPQDISLLPCPLCSTLLLSPPYALQSLCPAAPLPATPCPPTPPGQPHASFKTQLSLSSS